VVRRWISRELSPPAQIRRLAEDAMVVLRGLARHARAEPQPPAPAQQSGEPGTAFLWFAAGAAVAGAAFLLAAIVRLQ